MSPLRSAGSGGSGEIDEVECELAEEASDGKEAEWRNGCMAMTSDVV